MSALLLMLYVTQQPLFVVWLTVGAFFLFLIWRAIRTMERLASTVERLEARLDEFEDS